jgi:alcohol dehydrogenase class IV
MGDEADVHSGIPHVSRRQLPFAPPRRCRCPEAADHRSSTRRNARRAFVVCGHTVAHQTNLLDRIRDHLGSLYAGVFDAMDKDSTWPAVQRGVDAARAAEADLLIAVGGGSVMVGTRVIAILLRQKGDPYCLMTQYPGMPIRLHELDMPQADLPRLAQDTLKNFNANPGQRPDDYTARMLRLLQAAW